MHRLAVLAVVLLLAPPLTSSSARGDRVREPDPPRLVRGRARDEEVRAPLLRGGDRRAADRHPRLHQCRGRHHPRPVERGPVRAAPTEQQQSLPTRRFVTPGPCSSLRPVSLSWCSRQAVRGTSYVDAVRSTDSARSIVAERETPRHRYNGRTVRLALFAGIFIPTPTVRLAPYHPLPARMTTIAHPGGETYCRTRSGRK